MPPCDAPDSYGWTPVVGEFDINAPASAIVKWQPLYCATNNGGGAARLCRICGMLPTIGRSRAPTFANGKDASLRGSNGGRNFAIVRHSRRNVGEVNMAWKAPKIVEVPVGMEINMYACAARK
jgi:coenzyme PQQ precursor peptide PqqA